MQLFSKINLFKKIFSVQKDLFCGACQTYDPTFFHYEQTKIISICVKKKLFSPWTQKELKETSVTLKIIEKYTEHHKTSKNIKNKCNIQIFSGFVAKHHYFHIFLELSAKSQLASIFAICDLVKFSFVLWRLYI